MRAQSDSWFATYLLRIGNGTEETNADDYVILPDDILIKSPSEEICIDMLIDCVFPDLEKNYRSASYMRERAILSTRNEHVDVVNANMIDKFPGDKHVYYSFDEVEDDPQNNYPLEFLNSLTPNGLPAHELTIKKNCPIILLRNLDPHNGLCNGTRLIVRGLMRNCIDAEIANGQHAGTRVFIP
jgi:ATP-dependent DNA helicase PIF1